MTGRRLVEKPIAIGGPQPDLCDYNVRSSASNTTYVELIGENGRTLWEGAVTINATARALGYFIVALGGAAATAWPLAIGALVEPNGGDVQFNTSGSNADGSTPTIAPTANTLGVWTAMSVNAIGWVAR